MKVLIVGCGGREHAMAKHMNCDIYCAGTYINQGIYKICKGYIISDDKENIKTFCKKKGINYVVIGPEKYLENGMVDFLIKNEIPVIGPTMDYAQLETSKIFTREFMKKNSMEKWCPDFCSSNDNYLEFMKKWKNNYVVKADGLKGGKGVKVFGEHLNNDKEALKFIKTLDDFIIEEKLNGKEFSLFSLCDGRSISHFSPIKDFKRLFNGDQGPNTGGMGSISINIRKEIQEEAENINELIVEYINHSIEDERNYQGILYGSFMITENGLKVIEFNCRFGDPECINLLAVLATPLNEIFDAMIHQKLSDLNIYTKKCHSVCRYVVPQGYPDNPKKTNIEIDTDVIYASVGDNNKMLGSRAVAVVGIGETLKEANDVVEEKLTKIKGNVFYRTDIGSLNYTNSGVDIEKGNRVVANIGEMVKETYNENVKNEYGSFGNIMNVDGTDLVSSIDGVGTKTDFMFKHYGNPGLESLGYDIVHHSINDILVQGAIPLLFMDYFASSYIDEEQLNYFIKGVSTACRNSNCVLLGGETAEMPGTYTKDSFDIVGSIVGKRVFTLPGVEKGNTVLAIKSSGLHTNGYSLIRKLMEYIDIPQDILLDLSQHHTSYLEDVLKVKEDLTQLCHITGGGLTENPKRVLDGNDIRYKYWELPRLFKWIQSVTELSKEEMWSTFNCGIGMMLFTNEPAKIKEKINCFEIGKVI